MRSLETSIVLGLAFLAAGCRSSVQAKVGTGADAEGDLSAEMNAEGRGSGEGSGSGPGSSGAAGGGGGVAPAGPPIVTYPGFEVLPDGRSVVTVLMRGKVPVSEQVAEGRAIYALSGVTVPDKVNRLPLLTQHFPTQVSSVTVEQVAGGANVLIDLREPAKPTYKVSEQDGTTLLTVTFPKSEKWAKTSASGGTKGAGADDSTAVRGEEPQPGEGEAESDADDQADVESADQQEKESAETKRRRKLSKRQPIPYASRYLTLPRATLAPEIGVSVAGYGALTDFYGFYPYVYPFSAIAGALDALESGGSLDSASTATATAALRWGIIDQVELEVVPVPIRLSPNTAYSLPSIGVTAGYTQDVFEIAGRLRYVIPVDSDFGAGGNGILTVGAPVHVHLTEWARLDTGAFVTILPGGVTAVGLYERGGSPVYPEPGIPLNLVFSASEAVWLAARTGLSVYDFDYADETLAIPLGAEIGFTASDDYNPTGDLGLRVDFPQLFRPGSSLDVVSETAFAFGAWYRWYYHL